MKPAGTKEELVDDSYIAIAGEDKRIHIISIKRMQVFVVLEGKVILILLLMFQGHKDVIVDLAAHADVPHLLASASKDGTVRLWDIHTKKHSSWNLSCSVVV
jgi:WD40 repeat protein